MEKDTPNAAEGENSADSQGRYEVLFNKNLGDRITKLIEDTEEYCFVVTPYYNLWTDVLKSIFNLHKKNKKLFFIFRNPETEFDKTNKKNVIHDLNENINEPHAIFDIFFIDKLHAKIYLNEKQVLITSMNLQLYATGNNYEAGCLINDPSVSSKILENFIIEELINGLSRKDYIRGNHADWLENNFLKKKYDNHHVETVINDTSFVNVNEEVISIGVSNNEHENNQGTESYSPVKNTDNEKIVSGFCINCKKEIDYDYKQPLCSICKEEKHGSICHACGGNHPGGSKNYPLCNDCFDKYGRGKK